MGHKCPNEDATVVGLIPNWVKTMETMLYLIFSFSRAGNEAMHGVVFCT